MSEQVTDLEMMEHETGQVSGFIRTLFPEDVGFVLLLFNREKVHGAGGFCLRTDAQKHDAMSALFEAYEQLERLERLSD